MKKLELPREGVDPCVLIEGCPEEISDQGPVGLDDLWHSGKLNESDGTKLCFPTQEGPDGLQLLSFNQPRSGRTHTRRCGSCPVRTRSFQLTRARGRGRGRPGVGKGRKQMPSVLLLLYCFMVFPLPCAYIWLLPHVWQKSYLFIFVNNLGIAAFKSHNKEIALYRQ